jgi:hypothetical protein
VVHALALLRSRARHRTRWVARVWVADEP